MENKTKTPVSIGAILKIVLMFIVAACVAIFYWIPNLAWAPYRMPNGLYVEVTSKGIHVLESNGNKFSIYYIYENSEQSMCYGNKFVYKVDTADTYHRVMFNLYYVSTDSAPLRDKYAIFDDSFDDSNQKKAYVTFHTTETWEWNCKGTQDNGRYKTVITEGNDYISIGDLNFTKVNDETDLKEYVDILLDSFNEEAKEHKD